MELSEVHTRPETPRQLRTADVGGRRAVSITLLYGEGDIDAVAEAVGVDVGAAERDAMLLLLDDAIADVVRSGIRSALGDCIRAEVTTLQAGHCCGDDD